MTPSAIEPVTIRFVAEHLNHYATAVPNRTTYQLYSSYGESMCSVNKDPGKVKQNYKQIKM